MTVAFSLVAVMLVNVLSVEPQQPPLVPSSQDVPTCETQSRRLFGVSPRALGSQAKKPKRLRYVRPEYPEVPTGTVGSGTWLGEALIGPDGEVHTVSVLRDLKFKPPLPAFSRAISDSILKWRYAPTTVDGKAVPVCMTISVNINWR